MWCSSEIHFKAPSIFGVCKWHVIISELWIVSIHMILLFLQLEKMLGKLREYYWLIDKKIF